MVVSSPDFDLQVGDSLAYRQHGFPSLEALLRSFPDVCTFHWFAGELKVLGVANEATAHVQEMVAQQKGSRGKTKRGGGGLGGRGLNRGSHHGFQQPERGNFRHPEMVRPVMHGDVFFGRGGRGGFRQPPPFLFPGARHGFPPFNDRSRSARPQVLKRFYEEEINYPSFKQKTYEKS